MASVPLLNGHDAGTDTNLEAQYLSEEQPDFAQVIAQDPEGVIAYIEQQGVQDLGTFKVQVYIDHSLHCCYQSVTLLSARHTQHLRFCLILHKLALISVKGTTRSILFGSFFFYLIVAVRCCACISICKQVHERFQISLAG